MSFILDALRKSEHDRQREKGPGLAEVAVAPPRPKTNVWAAAAIALLLVNLVGVGVLLLHRARTPAPPPASAAAPPAVAATTTPPPATATAAPQASVTQTLPQPQLREPPPPASYPSDRNPLEREVAGQTGMDSAMAAQAAAVPAGPPAVSRTAAPQRGSVVYESLPEAVAQEAIAAEPPPAAQSQQPNLPNAGDAAASGGMPNLHLDLHVYAPRPQDRFVFVNSHKYREGDTLAEGPVVEQITQGGAVLNYRGRRFILTSN